MLQIFLEEYVTLQRICFYYQKYLLLHTLFSDGGRNYFGL